VTLENEHVEENDAEELVQLVDFKEEGSVRRRLWRMKCGGERCRRVCSVGGF
jgi:hypothetical protein